LYFKYKNDFPPTVSWCPPSTTSAAALLGRPSPGHRSACGLSQLAAELAPMGPDIWIVTAIHLRQSEDSLSCDR